MHQEHKAFALLTVLTLLISGVTAETADLEESDFEYLHENLDTEELKQKVNDNQDDIPGFVANIVGDHRINVEFQETEQNYSAVMEGTKVESLDTEHDENATLNIYVNETALDAIMESETPVSELKENLDKGEIEYETVNRSDAVRMFITERVLDIVSRFNVL